MQSRSTHRARGVGGTQEICSPPSPAQPPAQPSHRHLDLNLVWRSRTENTEADDLTNQRIGAFDPALRLDTAGVPAKFLCMQGKLPLHFAQAQRFLVGRCHGRGLGQSGIPSRPVGPPHVELCDGPRRRRHSNRVQYLPTRNRRSLEF